MAESRIQVRVRWGDTLWWSNVRVNPSKVAIHGDSRWRHDTLIGITRAYSRTYKTYVYRLTIGKLTVGISL